MYSDAIAQLKTFDGRLKDLKVTLNVEAIATKIKELEAKMAAPGFWNDNDSAQQVIAEVKRLKGEIAPVVKLSETVTEALELALLGETENDLATLGEIQSEVESFASALEEIELKATLNEPHDHSGAFVSIHAGAGGTESCDWAAILERMYLRFCETQGFSTEMLEKVPGEEAGIRGVTYQVRGPYAYGLLKCEVGVHRLVRISPFDAKGRRHTSFVAVDVIPELPDTAKEIDIREADLRIDTYRAGGAGGQHVNKTDSAVRITHIPTGIVVQCQNERSQHSNKATAMKMLQARLVREEEIKRDKELAKLYDKKGEIAFGAQIRSYTLQPFTLVKDHRTGYEAGNANGVLDGNVLPFIDAYLRHRRRRLGEG